MTIDWTSFTPWPSAVGGLLIGLAAALLVLGTGRVAGIAGIVGHALQALWQHRSLRGQGARWAFIGGMVAAPWLWQLAAPLPAARIDVGTGALVAAGLLVGFGVRLGSGCTSGHGVCGLSRLSLRSLVATLSFMAAGFAMVFVLRHVLGA